MRRTGIDNKFFERKSTRKINFLAVCFFTFFAIFNLSAQETPKPLPTPKPTATPTNPTPNYPTPTLPPATGTTIYRTPPPYGQHKKKIVNEGEFPAEKLIEVDPRVNISINCVSEGNVKINGWERDEIRAYVKDGSEVGFKVTQKRVSTGKPVQVNVLGYDPQKNKQIGLDECISGEEIELDVPRGATISINAGQSSVTVESVYKAKVINERGDIWLNDIAQGVSAQTFEGDVTVENSKGGIKLTSTSGNILALNVEPVEIGDPFYAKTNSGVITLQSVEHSQVISNSTSGMIKLISNIVSGGQYKFTTNNTIWLVIPSQSSLVFNAIYGNFQTEIPLVIDNISKTPNSQLQTRTGQIGSGDATITLQTLGSIRIKKAN